MANDEIKYYVGMRVIDMPEPPGPCTRKKCFICDEDVWVSNRTIKKVEADELEIICFPCSKTVTRPDTRLEAYPETIREVEEILEREERQFKKIIPKGGHLKKMRAGLTKP